MSQRHLVNWATALVGACLTVLLYVLSPPQLAAFDNSLRDYFFHLRGEIPTSEQVVIVDLDDQSIAEYGQWPWERNLVAQLLQKLSDDGAGIVGLDIVFAEPDKTSPAYLNQKHQLGIDNPLDYDEILGHTVGQTPTILGYVFKFENPTPNSASPKIPAVMIEKGHSEQSFFAEPQGIVPNLPSIQNQAYSSGFFNNIPDPSGMIRSVPLLMKYEESLYPSLSLEMLRIALNSPTIEVVSSATGTEYIQLGERIIPTDRHGQLFLNYRGPGYTFDYISAADVLQQNYDTQRIAGKFVLVGTSAPGLLDIRSMPLDNAYPGVEVHASAIDNILLGDTLSKPDWVEAADATLIFFIFFTSFILFNYLGALLLSISAILGYSLLYLLLHHMMFSEGVLLNILFPFATLSLSLLMATLFNYFFETRQKNLVKNKLSSKVSPSVMNEILKHESLDIMQGQTREVTVFFSDLRGFTQLSEAMPNPQTLIRFLNTYTTVMAEIISKQQGTIDKFIGDAIMAYWNAPASQENHADLAVTASLQQLQSLEKLNRDIINNPDFACIAKVTQDKVGPIEIGIGLNTGEAVVGEMGSSGRSDYTIIGDTVNLGARLESLCKFYGSTLNISHQTKSQLKNAYQLQFLDRVRVKGKTEAVEIWQVHDFGQPNEAFQNELNQYEQAIQEYNQAHFEAALTLFKALLSSASHGNTYIYEIYITRCLHYIENTPVHFDAIYEHTSK